VLKSVLLGGFIVTAGLACGAAVSLWQSGQAHDTVAAGYWSTDPDIGSAEADGLLRARVARVGLFALTRQEAVYYSRTVDEAGAGLDPACTYVLSGGRLPAGWWSVTLYAEDSFLARNTDGAASVNAETPGLNPDGWRVEVGPTRPEDGTPWLSTRATRGFDLTLRLYEPDASVLSSPSALSFPTLTRISCPAGEP
jgi:hypothetical protein